LKRKSNSWEFSKIELIIYIFVRYGYTAVKHQREVGTGYFDYVATAAAGGVSSTVALKGSTEEAQFHTPTAPPDEDEIVTVII
jgi:isocitrate lyase